ncbi:MAG: peptidylprolyl isomerase [Planctomycetota bacterium]|jgi:peptidylprolyl isomerase
MQNIMRCVVTVVLAGLVGCRGSVSEGSQTPAADPSSKAAATPDPVAGTPKSVAGKTGWTAGDKIPSGQAGVPDIQILTVHANGEGDVCGSGKSATLKYKAMKADGSVLDPGTRPFTFKVGARQAIVGWDIVVAKMRVGDNFTILLPQALAYGPSKGDLKFDMELLSFK